MTDILKKPVHIALLRPTELEKLAGTGKIAETQYGVDPRKSGPALPVEKKPKAVTALPKAVGPNLVKQAKQRVNLRVIHESVEGPDTQPPCNTCVAACCYVFVVNITQLEYESGMYGDAAVKVTEDMLDQLQGKWSTTPMMTAPRQAGYYLEGRIGEPCPFLRGNKCSIYDIRPITCRAYSCVGDSRITEEMRNGTEPLTAGNILTHFNTRKDDSGTTKS